LIFHIFLLSFSMEICILGAGFQGRVIAQDLTDDNYRITVIDNNQKHLQRIKEGKKIKTKRFDVSEKRDFIDFLKNFDLIVGALPAKLGFYAMRCAVEAGVDIIDISYAEEDPFVLDILAKKRKVRVVPDAGFAPGLSNILVGEAWREFGKIENLRIRVGGIPQNPVPPFNYRYTWSPDDLIAEYTRPARIIRNYREVKVEALSGIEIFTLPEIGKLECFYTDGLRTLLKTLRGVKNMEEKTIRYPGHALLMKKLLKTGFLPDEPNPFTNQKVKPKGFILDFLKAELSRGDELDLTILLIEVEGKGRRRRYKIIDYYDKRKRISSMARLTGYTAAIIARRIKNYSGFGIIPPEYLGREKDFSDFIKSELKRRGVVIKKKDWA